jgi:hypothetical protein
MQLVTTRFIYSLLALIGAGLLFNNFVHASELSVAPGQAVKLTVTASGTQPFTYQWRKNAVPISAATGDTYSIASATTADAASYSVVVANSVSSTTSDDAVLTVNTAAAVAPTITNQPVSVTLPAGQTASFSVNASGSGTLAYQWKKSGGAISGATSSTYSLAATTANAGSYSVAVSNAAGSVTSNAVALAVTSSGSPTVVAPTITKQPASITATAGQSASFSVTASGSAKLYYQWLKNGSTISGATSATYTLAATTANAGSYSVRVQNSAGWVASSAVVLAVTSSAVAPTIAAQPVSLTVTSGKSASFSVVASGTATLAYQWRKNGTSIPGATGASYSITAATTADAGSYTAVVTNAAGSVSSNSAALTVAAVSNLVGLTPLSFDASGQYAPTQGIAQLFDGQTSTKWLAFSATTWVQIVFASPTVLQAYSLTSANDSPERDPASWTLSGSNDGYNWTVIEKRTAQSWTSRLLTRDFVVPSSSITYTQFRFDFQATSGSVTQLAELELYGSGGSSQPTLLDFIPSSYSASGQYAPTQGIAQLFDGQTSTKWLAFSATTWVQIDLATPRSLQVYSLTSADDVPARDPASWTLSGSNDGANWTVIEKRTSQSWSTRLLARDFALATPSVAYSHFRFDFQATSGSNTQLAELELAGAP